MFGILVWLLKLVILMIRPASAPTPSSLSLSLSLPLLPSQQNRVSKQWLKIFGK